MLRHLFHYDNKDHGRKNSREKQREEINEVLQRQLQSIVVEPNDTKKSRRLVQNVLQKVANRFAHCDECKFSSQIKKAGSYATGTKIKSADEFDFDIILKDRNWRIKTSGYIIMTCIQLKTQRYVVWVILC